MLFQDSRGGLELQDPRTKQYLHAEPEDGALVLNTGDMLQRFTNGMLLFCPLSKCNRQY
jgi:isopenicillin N synthase-like dioxygenase